MDHFDQNMKYLANMDNYFFRVISHYHLKNTFTTILCSDIENMSLSQFYKQKKRFLWVLTDLLKVTRFVSIGGITKNQALCSFHPKPLPLRIAIPYWIYI